MSPDRFDRFPWRPEKPLLPKEVEYDPEPELERQWEADTIHVTTQKCPYCGQPVIPFCACPQKG